MTKTMKRIKIKKVLVGEASGKVLVKGWVRTVRHGKQISFIQLNDGSCLDSLQIIVEPGLANYETEIRHLTTGAAAGVQGNLVPSPGKGQQVELRADKITVYGQADSDYPLQKKRHTFEYLRTIAHLRPRSNTFGAIFRLRSAAAFAVHRFFRDRGFALVHTPIITTSDCEGAGEMFTVTALNPDQIPVIDGQPDFSADFFGKRASLTVSGQLEAETAALALSDVYTFGPTFRAENSNTARHLAEFWMVEPEMAFADLADDARLAEEFLREVCRFLLTECQSDLEFFNKRIDDQCLARLENLCREPFERISYTEAIEILARSGRSFEFPAAWGENLQSEHERYLAEAHFRRPVIVTDYPRRLKAFYMRLNDDEKTVAAMDVLVAGVGEIIGGSQREERLDVLRARLRESGLNEDDYRWYLDTRRFGSAPHAGFGLGFERFIQFISGMANIRDCIGFARVPGNAEF